MIKLLKYYFKISLKLFIKSPLMLFSEWFSFFKSYFFIKQELKKVNENINLSIQPCLFDKKNYSLNIQYYDYQNGWAFEKLLEHRPKELVDIGSNIPFLVFASKLTKVTTIDIRQHNIPIDNLKTKIGDILNIPYKNESIDFLSSLSVIEHIGLGRYGDDLDINGMQKAINEFSRVLKKQGILLISVPIGSVNKIEFNAHRRYTPEKIYKMFSDFSLSEEVYISKNGTIDINKYNSLDKPYAYGCYKFLKI